MCLNMKNNMLHCLFQLQTLHAFIQIQTQKKNNRKGVG